MTNRVQASIGAAQHYGPRVANDGLDNSVHKSGIVQERELFFDFEQANAGLPTTDADEDAGTLVIPSGSLIVAAYLDVGTAWLSGGAATLELGVEDVDGSAGDPDGFDTLAKAVLTLNAFLVLDGALIGAVVGSEDKQISIDDATAVFTAGTGRLVVRYIEKQV